MAESRSSPFGFLVFLAIASGAFWAWRTERRRSCAALAALLPVQPPSPMKTMKLLRPGIRQRESAGELHRQQRGKSSAVSPALVRQAQKAPEAMPGTPESERT